MVKVTTKWSKPLKYTWKWHLEKFRIKLKQSMIRAFDKFGGALFSSYRARVISRNSVEFKSDSPYAAAKEFGARIPARFPVNARALRFEVGGQVVFAMSARGFFLKPTPYLAPAIEEWMVKDTEVAWSK